jgi:hypothetical protein
MHEIGAISNGKIKVRLKKFADWRVSYAEISRELVRLLRVIDD